MMEHIKALKAAVLNILIINYNAGASLEFEIKVKGFLLFFRL